MLFREHKDVAVHSACRWLLNQWGFENEVRQSVLEIQTKQPLPGYSWHEDSMGICFAVFEPAKNMPGVEGQESSRLDTSLTRRFGLATHEFTRKQFSDLETELIRILQDPKQEDRDASTKTANRLKQYQGNRMEAEKGDAASPDSPITYVTWIYVAFGCNGLNQLAGIDPAQDVYSAPEDSWDMVETRSSLDLLGYRMPTGSEWEFACRTGVKSRFFFGDSTRLFEKYGWSVTNSRNVRQRVGLLKPNDNGLFDIQGNVAEYCHNLIDPAGSNRGRREVRDQSCAEETSDIDLFQSSDSLPRSAHERRGFRLARTYGPE